MCVDVDGIVCVQSCGMRECASSMCVRVHAYVDGVCA